MGESIEIRQKNIQSKIFQRLKKIVKTTFDEKNLIWR